MKSARHEMQELLKEYIHIADSLLDYTEIHHYDMHRDIMGYYEQIAEGDYSDREALRCQIVAVRLLIKAHMNMKYVFS